ncbi:MAG: hypothetical protein ABIJ16_07995 [Bacteroidota bacterium]
MKATIKFVFVVAFLSFATISFSQETYEWTLYKDLEGVQIYYRYADCYTNAKHMEYVLFMVINTTEESMEVEWKREIWYNGKCHNCDSDSPEYIQKAVLKPGESKEADCDSKKRGGKIFSKFLDFRGEKELTRFELTNISVRPL